jgi:hypothetical protein
MTNINARTAHVNLSPTGFRLVAEDYFQCYLDFRKPRRFSVVPYFLCCRAIELALKAMHLETKGKADVKAKYWHNLEKAYSDLPVGKQTLSKEELKLLKQVNQIYRKKDFEYFNVHNAVTGYERFPDLGTLAHLTKKIIRL